MKKIIFINLVFYIILICNCESRNRKIKEKEQLKCMSKIEQAYLTKSENGTSLLDDPNYSTTYKIDFINCMEKANKRYFKIAIPD